MIDVTGLGGAFDPRRAVWWAANPSWDDGDSADAVFTGGSTRLKGQLGRVTARALRHPVLVSRLLRQGLRGRSVAAFLVWLDSGWAFDFASVSVVAVSGRTSLVKLPRSRLREPRPSTDPVCMAMIAQDEEAVIADALRAAAAVADSMIVMDGGSTDRTREIARNHGATIADRPYDNELAQRNALQELITTRWTLVLDADEVVSPELAPLLRRALEHPEFDIIFLPWLNALDDDPRPFRWPQLIGRLFGSELRFQSRYHSTVQGFRRALYFPVNGPYVIHRKPALVHYRKALRYLDVAPEFASQSDEEVRWIRDEVARLEAREPRPEPGG